MIDPKLNELPADAAGDFKNRRAPDDVNAQAAGSAPRAGLSIRDTIAGDSNLSVGGRGVETSGVSAGAGAGAGSSHLSPGDTGSPAPNIVPAARSTGTTPRGDSGLLDSPTPRAGLTGEDEGPTYDEISQRAYHCWVERGSPHGSPEIDWDRARLELLEERRRQAMNTIAASA